MNSTIITYQLPAKKDFYTLIYKKKLIPVQNFNFDEGFFFISDFTQENKYQIKPEKIIKNHWVDLDIEFDEIDLHVDSQDEYFNNVNYIKELFADTELEKLVLSRIKKVDKPKDFDLKNIFQKLCNAYTNALVYCIRSTELGVWMGATPETLIHKNKKAFTTFSLAGTIKKGEEWSDKERKEQNVVTGFIEETLQKHSSNIKIKKSQILEINKIQHILNEINFQKPDLNSLVKDLHPTPAVSGLPQQEAIDYIDKIEKHERKLYAGIIGVWDDRDKHLFVNLRCMQVFEDKLALYVGGGLNAASDAQKEWQETERKSEVLLQHIQLSIPNDFKNLFCESFDAEHYTKLVDEIKEGNKITSIRLHPQKGKSVNKEFLGEKIPWTSNAYYLTNRPNFDKQIDFLSGTYYVQEASSMFLEYFLKQLNVKSNPMFLDLCAAPGGKSTVLLDFLNGNGTLISNEVIRSRVKILSENLTKWGYSNQIITNADSDQYMNTNLGFDVVLVDAPCSGEGMWRKNHYAISKWSLDNVKLCQGRQKRILQNAKNLVNHNGYLIYSTCTYNKDENETPILDILNEGFELCKINVPEEWNVVETSLGYQFFPHLLNGEGFYISVFKYTAEKEKKKSKRQINQSISAVTQQTLSYLEPFFEDVEKNNYYLYQEEVYHYTGDIPLSDLNSLRIFSFGQKMGKLVKNGFRPNSKAALSLNVKNDFLRNINLNDEQLQLFLSRKNIVIEGLEDGWLLLKYKNLNLGFVKIINNILKL